MESKLKQNSLKSSADGGLRKNSNHASQPLFNKTPMETLIDDVSDAANRLNKIQLGDEIEQKRLSSTINNLIPIPKTSLMRLEKVF